MYHHFPYVWTFHIFRYAEISPLDDHFFFDQDLFDPEDMKRRQEKEVVEGIGGIVGPNVDWKDVTMTSALKKVA